MLNREVFSFHGQEIVPGSIILYDFCDDIKIPNTKGSKFPTLIFTSDETLIGVPLLPVASRTTDTAVLGGKRFAATSYATTLNPDNIYDHFGSVSAQDLASVKTAMAKYFEPHPYDNWHFNVRPGEVFRVRRPEWTTDQTVIIAGNVVSGNMEEPFQVVEAIVDDSTDEISISPDIKPLPRDLIMPTKKLGEVSAMAVTTLQQRIGNRLVSPIVQNASPTRF